MPKTIQRDWFYIAPYFLRQSDDYYDDYGCFLQVARRDMRLFLVIRQSERYAKGYQRDDD